MAFNTKKSFFDSVRFCQKLDGQMATVKDNATFLQMWETFNATCPREEGGEFNFFTGHTDLKVEGEWRDVNTGDLISWDNYWARDQPDGGSSEQAS